MDYEPRRNGRFRLLVIVLVAAIAALVASGVLFVIVELASNG